MKEVFEKPIIEIKKKKSNERKKRLGKNKIIGEAKHHKKFYSKILGNRRDIIVWLPPSYPAPRGITKEESFSVLYMHDGQNLFNPKTSFSKVDWRVDETVTKLIIANKIEEIIVVGIYNTPNRLNEYSISENGEEYLKFIIEELKPFIDENYYTKTGRENTAIIGSSMGGLISFLAVWKFSEIFSKAGCLSSSFYYGRNKAIKMVKNNKGEIKNIKIYIDHGEDGLKEGQRMFCALTKKGYIIGTDIDYYYAAGAQHNEAAWAERLERPLIFLFGK